MPRATKSGGKGRHDPLHVQLKQDELHEKYGSVSHPGKRKKPRRSEGDEEDGGEVILDSKTSKRIFELARDQQEELEERIDEEDDEDEDESLPKPRSQASFNEDDDDDDDMGDGADIDADDAAEEFQIESGDLQTLDTLLPPNAGERRTLADIIFAKLEDGPSSGNVTIKYRPEDSDQPPDPTVGLNPRVVQAYTTIGMLLSRYRSGPLPKPFKVLPSLPEWARLLAITRPESWTPAACRAATRVFISTMRKEQSQLFLKVVLLDAIREDIHKNGKLNVHYYEALIKSLYKPGSFFKGILFPLVDTGCTLKEAAIVASVLAKAHIPVLPASGALMRLANMDYSGSNSLFIRVLIDKKHALPYKVLDALVFHFIRLSNTYKAKKGESDKLPVLWHQSLLVFCQRYANDLSPDQKDALLDVVRVHHHAQIGPEVRRELVNSVCRGELRPEGDVEMS